MVICWTPAELAGFDVLLTTDKKTGYQQNLSGRKIAIIVLGQQQWPKLKPHMHLVIKAVHAASPASYVEVAIPQQE